MREYIVKRMMTQCKTVTAESESEAIDISQDDDEGWAWNIGIPPCEYTAEEND